jgi:hypothetical protein
VKYV